MLKIKYLYILYKTMNNEHFKLKYLKYKKKYLELSQMDGGYFGGAT